MFYFFLRITIPTSVYYKYFSSELKFRVRAGRKKYLDVWLVNFFTNEDTNISDDTSLFMLQLACIVNQVR